jgi:DNA repair exonuclease SbcCD ATPase subunit
LKKKGGKLKIIKLVANNIKKLKAIEITPQGDVVIISGKNGQGKTNVLEAIWYALAGSKNIPTEPIRKGEEEGDIELDLGEYIVSRKFTKGGENTYLEVRNKDGAKFPSPQALLDKLIGDVSFNPIDLMRSNNRDEMLLDIAGLSGNLKALDDERQEKYNQRTFENKEAKKLEAQIKKGLEKAEPINIQKLLDDISDVKEIHSMIDNLEKEIQCKKRDREILLEKIKQTDKNIEETQECLNTFHLNKRNAPPLEELQTKLQEAEEINQKARDFQENEKIKAAYKERKEAADRLTERIAEIDYAKETLIGEAQFPVLEMGYRDGKVTYKDIPLNQLSKSEELILGVQIQMALLPKLKVILIPDASLLDSENMKKLEEITKDNGYQVWVEKVGEDETVGVYIENGEIKGDNQ